VAGEFFLCGFHLAEEALAGCEVAVEDAELADVDGVAGPGVESRVPVFFEVAEVIGVDEADEGDLVVVDGRHRLHGGADAAVVVGETEFAVVERGVGAAAAVGEEMGAAAVVGSEADAGCVALLLCCVHFCGSL